MAERRPHLPNQTETEVLVRSRRRCCLCFGLNFDTSYKRIQIAHLDGDRANNKLDNLAALCHSHHDEYDSTYKQTKGLTLKEVKHHRQQLYNALEQKDEQLVLNFTSANETPNSQNENNAKVATPSAQLLGKVLEAYDTEVKKQTNSGYANGLSLTHWARIAIDEYGDFDVANEALISLIRLSSITNKNWPVFSWPHVPSATPSSSAVIVLHLIHTRDYWAFLFAILRIRDWVMQDGELELQKETQEKQIPDTLSVLPLPNKTFESWSATLYLCFRTNAPIFEEWAANLLLGAWKNMTLRMALNMAERGFDLPEGPLWKWIQEQMNETENIAAWLSKPETIRPDILFAVCCQRLSRLPDPCFQKITNMKYEMNISGYRKSPTAPSMQENLLKLRRLAFLSPVTNGIVEVKVEEAIKVEAECRKLVEEMNVFGTTVVETIKGVLIKEREQYLSLSEDERSYVEAF